MQREETKKELEKAQKLSDEAQKHNEKAAEILRNAGKVGKSEKTSSKEEMEKIKEQCRIQEQREQQRQLQSQQQHPISIGNCDPYMAYKIAGCVTSVALIVAVVLALIFWRRKKTSQQVQKTADLEKA